jgi:citrate synthase
LHEVDLSYRGHRVTDLMGTRSFEEVAELLWDQPTAENNDVTDYTDVRGEPFDPPVGSDETRWSPHPGVVQWMQRAVQPEDSFNDRLVLAVTRLGSLDPARFSASPHHVASAARAMIGTAIAAISPGHIDDSPGERSVAMSLTTALVRSAPPPARGLAPPEASKLAGTIEATMVAMADHELAASTLAARVAASTRADVYACVVAALAAMRGPLHGGASDAVRDMLLPFLSNDGAAAAESEEARLDEMAERLIGNYLQRSERVPGFGHAVYRQQDPRFVRLMELIASPDTAFAPTSRVLAAVERAGRRHLSVPPNVDLAIGALAAGAGLGAGAGQQIATVSRIAGWAAHIAEEYRASPLRYRTRGVFVE